MNIPLTMKGTADFMIENILPVVLAAHLLGFSMEKVRQVLVSIRPSDERIPGRMNLFNVGGINVIVDYAHNPHGIKALGEMLKKIETPKTGIIAGVGDRRDEDITAVGRTAAAIYDRVIIRTDSDTRGRVPEDIESLLVKGLKEVKPEISYEVIPDYDAALEFAIEHAKKGEYIVISAEKVEDTIHYVKTLQNKYGSG
jgi:cyanophycin synthetase